MSNIYVRTGPFDDASQSQGSLSDASDPWAAFPDVPSAAANMADPWAEFPDEPPQAPTYANDPWAAFPDAPPVQKALSDPFANFPGVGSPLAGMGNSGDPWAAFPDWPPAQARFGNINPFAGSPATPWSLPASSLPGNAPWPVNEVPPVGALFSASRSFGDFASPPASDPWAVFPDWPPVRNFSAAYENSFPSNSGLIDSRVPTTDWSTSPLPIDYVRQQFSGGFDHGGQIYPASFGLQPHIDPILIQAAIRNAACTNASYTCLDNSTSREMSRKCQEAEKACNELIEKVQKDPLPEGIYSFWPFPDGTSVWIGGPNGAIWIEPSRMPGAKPPGPMR
jgi:hypothetical protein